MKIDQKLKHLGPVEFTELKTAVLSVPPETWFEDKIRQEMFADVHQSTRSIIMVFIDLAVWPSIRVNKRSGWDLFAKQAQPIIEDIVLKHYKPGGVVIRAMIANLLAGERISPHIDTDPSFAIGHRIHVPLVTNGDVDFRIGGELFHLKEGLAYEINNLEMHAVHNRSNQDRLHLIFDYVER
ncbi:MAG: aspartyl/asparaginyl beta-hydroxylase domain-containing protein [Micropepsaceae bacterium]